MSIFIDPNRPLWMSRTPVRHGHIDPPHVGPFRYGPPSTSVQRRLEEAETDRRMRENNPQLQPGMLVIVDRAPFRVLEIRELPDDVWPEKYETAWQAAVDRWIRDDYGPAPERATWKGRPVAVMVEPEGGGKRRHLGVPASRVWDVLPEHYAVCRSCGELPPCSEELMDRAVDREVRASERLLSVAPGCCLGCGEAITHRMKAIRFPGENLLRPDLGEGSAAFHARQECSGYVHRYRELWTQRGAPADEQQPTLPL